MKIKLHSRFKKAYRGRIAHNQNLVQPTEQRIILFKVNPNNSLLKDHGLSGAKRELRAFSITGDIRLVYRPISDMEVIFLDIGSHNQVY